MKTINPKNYKYFIIILAIVISALIIIAGKYYYEHDKQITRLEKYNELKAIADLKTNEIVQWHNERLSEASFFSKHEMMIEETYRLVNGNKKSAKILQKSLIHLVDGKRYENIFILNTNGAIIFSLDSTFSIVDSTLINLIQKVQNTHNILFSDFYKCSKHKSVHFDIIAPFIDNKNNVFATLIFRINPNDYLYPLIQNWPTPSKSAETLIVRSDGDSVVFLNELRHIKETALRLKMPTSLKYLPANKAISGRTGIFEGIDYRNINVISDLRSIPGTNWYMVAKVDKDEIFKELYKEAIFITVLTLLIILFLVALLIWIYNKRQKNIYKELLVKEIELHQSQEEYRTTLYSIGDGVITTDKKGLVKQINPVAEKLTGWTEKEAKGKKLEEVFQIINEETHNIVENPVKKVLKEGLIVGLANHTLLISKNGNEIPIADSGAPIKDVRGNITGVVLVFRDQSEERLNQKILKESEQRLRLTLDNMLEGCQIINFDWRYVYINSTAEKHNRRPKTELIGNRYMDMWPGIENTEVFRVIKQCLEERIPIYMENNFYYPDGTSGWFELNIEPVPEGVFILSIDITERKKVEKELQESKEQLRFAFEGSNDGLWDVNLITGSVYLSPRGCEILGYLPEELPLVIKVWSQLVHPDDMNHTNECLETHLKGEKPIFEVEQRLQMKSGEWKWILARGKVVSYDQQGKAIRMSGTHTDISKRKKAEIEILKRENLLQKIFDILPIGLWFTDKNGKILKGNPAGIKIWGAEPKVDIDEYKVFKARRLPSGEEITDNDWALYHTITKGVTITDELLEIDAFDGTKKIVLNYTAPIFDNDGNIDGAIIVNNDITNLRLTEAQLKERELLFQALMDNSPVYIFFKDRDIKSMHLSKNYEQMLGKPLSELIGKDMFDLFPSELAKKMIEDDKKIVNEGKMVVVDEVLNDHYYTTIKFPILQEDNEPILAGFTIDITDRKKVEQELVKLNEELEQRIKERTQDLENKNSELERMNKAFVGREMRIKELKEKINQIESSNREN